MNSFQLQTEVMRRARRLHQLALGLLTLQLLLSTGQHPLVWGGGLLVLMAALKLRESHSRVDLQRVALTEWVTVGLLAVLQPELAPSLLQGLTTLVVLAALLEQEAGGQRSLRQTVRRSLQLGLAALPLLVVLFLLLPRLGPLWSMPGGAAGRIGIDGVLDPGGITQLVQDPTPALRISWIQGAPPPQPKRYWRVLVLDRFDGRRWSRGPLPVPPVRPPDGVQGLMPAQIWVAAPSPLQALPWAGSGQPSEPTQVVSTEGVLVGPAAGGHQRRYGISNAGGDLPWRAVRPGPLDLSLPPGSNPMLEALAASWRQLPALGRVQAAQALFARQQLRYTLNPRALPQQAPLDALLYETREGFCEHFASAFTALMRAAAVPARVVVGYQGGEWVEPSALGAGYLEVRQSDAHAWSEIWLEGQGWVQVDPTAWVAPERINQGPATALSGLARTHGWWHGLERSWTQLDLAWNRWVLSFDASQQASLLGRWQRWQGLLLLVGLTLALMPAVWWLQRSGSVRMDRDRQRLEQVLTLLQGRGLRPAPGEDLRTFCERAGCMLPHLKPHLLQLGTTYDRLRFEPMSRHTGASRAWRDAQRELAQLLRQQERRPVKRPN